MTNTLDMPLRAVILPVTPFQQNCTILWCTKTMDGVIIDPGGDVPNILQGITETGINPTGIWLTHGHIDHAGGVAELNETLNLPVTGPHEADKFLLDGLEVQGREYGFAARNCTPNTWLDEGDTVTVGEVSFAVRHCPGHSPGHVVFLNEQIKFGHVGDVLFQGSIGRTDFPYGDHDALIHAIKEKLLPLPDDFTFICGHGPASTIGNERMSNPFLK
jgi:glyoxylase-like metal-dependent hydrolase (beta-lactamase superfamily II)